MAGDTIFIIEPWFWVTSIPLLWWTMTSRWARGLWLVPLLWLPLQAARWRRRALAPSELLLVAATAVIALGWTSALLGDGYSELTRHLHLAQNALLLAWVLLACRAAD